APDSESLPLLRRLAPRSVVVVPLIAHGQILGALVLGTGGSERQLGPEDLRIAEELARRAAVAIDNARLYRETQAAVGRRDEALALLDTLLAAAPIGLAFLDRTFHFVRLNDALAEMIGPPRTEILGRTVSSMLPRLWTDLDPLLREVLAAGLPVVNREITGETPAQPGVRRTWLVNYYPVCVHENEIAGIGVVVVEITERKRAEEERERLLDQLGKEQAWLRTVIERTPAGVILIENSGEHQVVVNRRAEELLGRAIATTRGPAGYDGHLFTLEGALCTYENLPGIRALYGEAVGPEEFVIRPRGGGQVPVLITAGPIRDADNQILGSVVVFEDISTLKELERLREEWTAVIAHDLRQPVTIIKGYADRLSRQLRRLAPLVEQEKSLEHIRAAALNLNRMISDLLDVSRIEARRLTLEKRSEDFPSLIHAVVERMAAVTSGHPVRVEILESIPEVELDPSRIEQVLDNLLSNAAKYSDPSSEIVTTVRRQDDQVEVVVTNRGAGIAPEELSDLFTRFFRTRTARERGIAGVGLGLYVTKGLVEAHGGKIWAESVPGQTTSFHVVLPVDGAPAERVA
ncbi:MAG TPA: ATP-binding protein, partial [Chloroflexota bacterium]|nr:ATP-binding protein [Chloroflexota bacterium]